MALLLPGYPQDNPILRGIASIAAGADPEAVIAARDRQLSTSVEFARAALQAAPWLPSASPLVKYLIKQSTLAFDRASAIDQDKLLAQAADLVNSSPDASGHVLLDLYIHWRTIVEDR